MLTLLSIVLAADPQAVAGEGVLAHVGDTVILNGVGSHDPDGDQLTWVWTQTSGPPVALADADSAYPSFEVTAPGTLRFQLMVGDGATYSAPDPVVVVVPDKLARPLGDERASCASAPGSSAGLLAGLLALLRRR